MKDIQKIIENSVFAESVIQECKRMHNADVKEKLNRMLYDKAQGLGISLYQACAMFVPKITSEVVEVDPFLSDREWPRTKVVTEIILVPRQDL